MIGIVTSSQDPLGKNVRENLLRKGFSEVGEFGGSALLERGKFLLIETKKSLLEAEHLDFDVEAYLFASRHVSEAGINSLTAHFPGNWNDAKYGGEKESFGLAMPSLMKTAFLGLEEGNLKGYKLSLEATHHGPTELDKPALFVEVGSSPRAWEDFDAIDVLSQTLLKPQKTGFKPALGFGGGHYPSRLSKVELETEIAFGHIGPNYAKFNEKNLKNAIERTLGARFCVVDRDGLKKGQREVIERVAEGEGLEVISVEEAFELF